MDKREFKNKLYNDLTIIAKAMANPHRLEIIELLAQAEYSVEQIAEQVHLSVANTSQHLQTLKTAQLVSVTRRGNFIFYTLASQSTLHAWKSIQDLGRERIASIEATVKDYRTTKTQTESVTIDQLLEKLNTGKVTILDVRPEVEFNHGHIANARSIPHDQLKSRFKELPKRSEIVAYCRGPFCLFADDAVALLLQQGYKAKRLEKGFPDWQLLGLPIELN
jgi:rhodanese-related sulfurtransferase/DNA-binding transcriptional ArsR family regulator